MISTKTVAVAARKLRNAFNFVSTGDPFDHSAWICLDTDKIYGRSPATGLDEEDLPEDIDDSDRFLALPSQHDLDLSHRLALTFAAQRLPGDYHKVAGFVRQRGAYSRFKNLLQTVGRLASLYDFENRETDEASLSWCAEHGIQPVADKPDS